jgi:5'-nucleotidase
MSDPARQRILVTNDDGIESEGIHELTRALAATGHEIVVVAPNRNWSGAGAAIGDLSPNNPLGVTRVQIPGAPDVAAFAVDGPPALCVISGCLGAFGERPTLIVSGPNAGLNTGRVVLHSGTVGAILTGQNFGLSGLAVSLDGSWGLQADVPWHWDTAAAMAVEVLDLVIAAPPRSALNLNVPALPRDEVLGIRWAKLASFGAIRARVKTSEVQADDVPPDGSPQVEMTFEPTGHEPAPDTDEGCVRAGYAAITTLAGIVEAWDDGIGTEVDPAGFSPVSSGTDDGATARPGLAVPRITPGADLHEVHRIPDAHDHTLLRRPDLVIDTPD